MEPAENVPFHRLDLEKHAEHGGSAGSAAQAEGLDSGSAQKYAALGLVLGVVLIGGGGFLFKDQIRGFVDYFIEVVDTWGPLGCAPWVARALAGHRCAGRAGAAQAHSSRQHRSLLLLGLLCITVPTEPAVTAHGWACLMVACALAALLVLYHSFISGYSLGSDVK